MPVVAQVCRYFYDRFAAVIPNECEESTTIVVSNKYKESASVVIPNVREESTTIVISNKYKESDLVVIPNEREESSLFCRGGSRVFGKPVLIQTFRQIVRHASVEYGFGDIGGDAILVVV